jgi:hypothetical protein
MHSPIQLRPEDRLPDLTTPLDGRIGQSGIGKVGCIQYGRERFLSLYGHTPFAPSEQTHLSIVKQLAEIICTNVVKGRKECEIQAENESGTWSTQRFLKR